MQITKRSIRKSGYGDYFAIDEITEQQKVIETPLYLRKNEKFKDKLQALSDADNRSRKNWMETVIIQAVNSGTVKPKQSGNNNS
jgi:hypothetical protein